MIFEQYTNDQSRGLVFVSRGSVLSSDGHEGDSANWRRWCLWLDPLRSFKSLGSRMPLPSNRSQLLRLDTGLVPLFTCSREDGPMDDGSIEHMAWVCSVVLAM